MSYRFKGEKIIINGEYQHIIPAPLSQTPEDGCFAIDIVDNKFKVYNEGLSRWVVLGDADDVVFDNSNSNLISTNTEAAIKELDVRTITPQIQTYSIRSTGETQTNSTNDIILNGMTLTPPAGAYIFMAGASFKHFNSSRIVYYSIYKGNSQEPNTLSEFTTGANNQARETQQMWSIAGEITVNGNEAITIRWRSNSGTARTFLRYLTLIRVG